MQSDLIVCKNKCVFCFIDQLPKGLRQTLYIKDDDYSLSFMYGNYVSLTNLTDKNLKEILTYKISPLYVSVHTTSHKLRGQMLQNENAPNILEQLSKLANAGITLYTQIVYCPNFQSLAEIEKTLSDLYSLSVQNVAIVPVGLTKHRKNLTHIDPVTKEIATSLIDICKSFKGFAFLADEIYLKAQVEIPKVNHYKNFSQIENGVGMLAKFKHQFEKAIAKHQPTNKVTDTAIITGVSASPFIKQLTANFIDTITIENNFFGNSVTVAGLITAQDIINTFKGKTNLDEPNLNGTNKYKKIIIPRTMLNEDLLFLDNISVNCLQKELNCDIIICEVNGTKLAKLLAEL
ncbi:MAG: DUF512 domain-containing protein [Firmicutes bacterium]|nr:DUF512 domain-containing protein [Bacillota bacterium]